jgi:uncharacterized protein (DUF302 family)
MSESIGLKAQLKMPFDDAIQRTTEALKAEGFGVITDVDIKATFKSKLDVDFRPYRILGACNPKLAHSALSSDAEVGMLLPCNVTVAEVEEGVVEVSAVNPLKMLDIVSSEAVHEVAKDAYERLTRTISALQS